MGGKNSWLSTVGHNFELGVLGILSGARLGAQHQAFSLSSSAVSSRTFPSRMRLKALSQRAHVEAVLPSVRTRDATWPACITRQPVGLLASKATVARPALVSALSANEEIRWRRGHVSIVHKRPSKLA
jgi:hypothetical protein